MSFRRHGGTPIAKFAKIVGWSPATMVRMAARYGHFSLNELRGAVESINGTRIEAESLVFSPVSRERTEAKRPNGLILLAPQVGLEPTTLRLTAECSAIELLRSAWRLFVLYQIIRVALRRQN